jgi:16S rRNA processing protein RimM
VARTRLVVAQVRGLHGLQGAVRVEVLTDKPEARFAPGEVLHVEGDPRALTIRDAQPVEDGPGWRLVFDEAASRQAAEWLRDAYLEVEVDREADLEAGAAYWHEVIGSTVRDSKGVELGKVAEVYRAGETEVYVVRGGAVGEFDLPSVRDIITTFAPERGELIVDEAVLDLGGAVVEAPPKTAKPRRRPRWSRHGKGARPSAVEGAPAPDAGASDAGASDAEASPGDAAVDPGPELSSRGGEA